MTGARGVVGHPLVEAAKENHTVIAVSRQSNSFADTHSVVWLKCNLSAPVTRFPHCDLVIHTAPLWLLAKHIPNLKGAGVSRIIAFSSTSAITKVTSSRSSERAVAEQLARAESECLGAALQQDIPITVLRPTMIYGYRRDQNVAAIAGFITRFRMFPLPRHSLGLRQPVHALDLVKASLSIVGNSQTFGNIYNVSGGEVLTYRDMVGRVFHALGQRPRLPIVPTHAYRILVKIVSVFARNAALNTDAVRRMTYNFNFSHNLATRDFDFRPERFLEHPARDLAIPG